MEELKQISAEASAAIEAANDLKILEQLRVDYLGKKGALTAVLKGLSQLPVEERPAAGAKVNEVKALIQNQPR